MLKTSVISFTWSTLFVYSIFSPLWAFPTETVSVADIEALVGRLSDPNETIRAEAIDELTQIREPAVIFLQNILTPEISHVNLQDQQLAAIEVLSRIGAPAVKALLCALSDWKDAVHSSALTALLQMENSVLEKFIERPDDVIKDLRNGQSRYLENLGYLPRNRYGEILLRITYLLFSIMNDPNETGNTKQHAANALAEIEEPTGVDYLIQQLGNPELKIIAATALERLLYYRTPGNPQQNRDTLPADVLNDDLRYLRENLPSDAIDGLIAALYDSNLSVRIPALDTLGFLGDARALPHLTRMREEPDNIGYHRHINSALARIGGPDAVEPLISEFNQSEAVKENILEVLGGIDSSDALDFLINLIDNPAIIDDRHDLRGVAIRALGRSPRRRAIERLIQYLGNPNLCVNAEIALGHMIHEGIDFGDMRDAVVQGFIQALNISRQTMFYALSSIERLGDPHAIGPLLDALRQFPFEYYDAWLREMIICTLRRCGASEDLIRDNMIIITGRETRDQPHAQSIPSHSNDNVTEESAVSLSIFSGGDRVTSEEITMLEKGLELVYEMEAYKLFYNQLKTYVDNQILNSFETSARRRWQAVAPHAAFADINGDRKFDEADIEYMTAFVNRSGENLDSESLQIRFPVAVMWLMENRENEEFNPLGEPPWSNSNVYHSVLNGPSIRRARQE